VPPAPEAEIFSTLQALVGGRRRQALKSIEVLLREGHSEFYILAMLLYQFRTLLIVRAGLDSGQRVHDIVREGKLKQFAVEKNLPYARRFSRSFLMAILTKVLATEFAIKQGKVDPTTGLMMLVLGLVAPKLKNVSA
jgi:DNA polymerase III delta subunit